MPLPTFTVTGALSDLVGAEATGIKGTSLIFTPNLKPSDFITWSGDNTLHRVRPVPATTNSEGVLAPVDLLAQDDSLSITNLQWTVAIQLNGTKSTWTFNAGAPGETVTLKQLVPVPNTPVQGVVLNPDAIRGIVTDYLVTNPPEASEDAVRGAVDDYLETNPPQAPEDAVRAIVDAYLEENPTPVSGVLGGRVVFDGDSITIGATTQGTWNQGRGGWAMEMARLSNGRVDIVYNAGVGGTGIDTRLANFNTKVAPYAPQTVILSNGTNDVATMALSEYLSKLTAYYENVKAIGAQLVLGGIYPKSKNASTIARWNIALQNWAAPRGVIVIPFWQLADPTTGAWPSGWSSDGTHPLRESQAFAALGKLAWDTLATSFTKPIAPTPFYIGEGLYTNFFTDLTATITGTAAISAITATTGTLPAGQYTYRVVPRTYWGKNDSYGDNTITLASTGGVTLTVTGSGTYTRRAVYRKGPADTQFKYIGQVTTSGTQTFTDSGIAAGYDWEDGDSSRVPNGLANGATQDLHTLAYGPPIRPGAAEGVRGNILRLTRHEGSGMSHIDRVTVTGLTAGQEIIISCKCRGANTTTATERIQIYFRDPGDATNIEVVPLIFHRLSTDWGLVFKRLVVPAGSDRLRVSFEGDATSPYIDVAELYVVEAPTT
ncbi:lipase [Mycobacterium phage Kersh]|uniref:Lipase n=1 Tax=Mycobacterium phage Kersh TaxID=1897501 RepID=A0A1D8EXR2_9CAUD|nr:esterase/lipase [Mycobacterium phage Kersh]AOT26016.1 lipase [Mycobacterium phage Kersh]